MKTKPVARELRNALFSTPGKVSLLFSFSFYKALAVIVFTEAFLFPTFRSGGNFVLESQVIFYIVCALVCIAAAVFLRKNTELFSQNWYAALVLLIALIGLFFLYLRANASIQDRLSEELCFYLGIGFLGLGFMGFHIELGRLFGYLGMSKTLVFGVLSSCIGAILYLAYTFSGQARWVLIAIYLIVSVTFFYRTRNAIGKTRIYNITYERELKVPYRFMLTSLMQGVSFGFIYGMLTNLHHTPYPPIECIGMLGAALLTVVTLLVSHVDFNRSIYRIGFPLVAFSMLGMGLFLAQAIPLVALQVIGFLYLDLVLWALGSYLIKDCDQPATWVAACPSAMLMTGRAGGVVVGGFLPEDLQSSALLVGAFIVILAALLLSSESNIRTGWGFIRPGDPRSTTDITKMCSIIAKEHQLTPREAEVLKALVDGRDSDEIAKELYISPNTVKSHIQNIYSKLGIHSRKELLRLSKDRQRLLQEDSMKS